MSYKQVLRSDKTEGREHLILFTAVSNWNEEFWGMISERSKEPLNIILRETLGLSSGAIFSFIFHKH